MKSKLAAFGRGGALMALALAALVATGTAQAGGTPAGTVISNTATLDYSVGNVPQTQIGSSKTGNTTGAGSATTFVVDNKVNVQVDAKDTVPVTSAPGQLAVTTTFTVSNTGNNTQDFVLSAKTNVTTGTAVLGSSDNFDLTGACTFQVDATGGGLGPWVAQSYIGNMVPDQVAWIRMLCPIPAGRSDGDIAGVALIAEAKTKNTSGTGNLTESTTNDPDLVDIVFADIAGSDDNARDAKHSARSAYQVNASRLTISKTASTVCDPINGSGAAYNTIGSAPIAIPGAYVKYTVTIANAAAAGASASLSQIQDQLSTSVAIDPDLIQGTGAGLANCKAATNPASALTKSFRVNAPVARSAVAYPKYLTSATGDTDGAGVSAGGLITVDFQTVLPAENGYLAGLQFAGEQVQLIYQVKIN
jgi:hypothetical protein